MQRLDVFMAENKLVNSRRQAQELIKNNGVKVNGIFQNKTGYFVDEKDKIEIVKEICPYVSRAGYKLEGAKESFNLNFNNKIVLDIGSSTGGFSDFCLQNGCKKIYCVDVGTSQLADKIKNNPKVVVMEKTDIREVTKDKVSDVDIIVCDVSFISLTLISHKIYELLNDNGECVVLIKPQFECGKALAKKFKGIIKDAKIHKQCIDNVVDNFAKNGLILQKLAQSKIKGGDGNTEFVALFYKNNGL